MTWSRTHFPSLEFSTFFTGSLKLCFAKGHLEVGESGPSSRSKSDSPPLLELGVVA